MSPQQVDQMSMWQYKALAVGQVDEGAALSTAEADDLWQWLQSKD